MASAALNFKVREKLTGSQLTRLTAHSSLQDPCFYCYESDVWLWLCFSCFCDLWICEWNQFLLFGDWWWSDDPQWKWKWQCLQPQAGAWSSDSVWQTVTFERSMVFLYSAYSCGPSAAYSNSKDFDSPTLLSSVTTFKSKNMNIWRYWVLNIEWVWRSKCKNLNLSLSLGLGLSFMEW